MLHSIQEVRPGQVSLSSGLIFCAYRDSQPCLLKQSVHDIVSFLKRICGAGFKNIHLTIKSILKSLQYIIAGVVGRKKYMFGTDGVQVLNGLFKILFSDFLPWRFSRPPDHLNLEAGFAKWAVGNREVKPAANGIYGFI